MASEPIRGGGAQGALLTEGAGYMVVEIAQQAIALLVLPIFFFFLSVEDFGVITLSLVLTQFASTLGSMGLDFSLMRFYFKWSEADRGRIPATVLLLSVGWSLILGAGGDLLLRSLTSTAPQHWPLALGWWSGLLLAVRGIPLSIVRVNGAVRKYAMFVLGGAVLQAAVQAGGVVAGGGPTGYMAGYAIGAAGSALLAFAAVRRDFRWAPFTWRLPADVVAYTARVLPSMMLVRLMAAADRMVLARFATIETLGIYGAASRFTVPVKFLSGGFKMALGPVLSREEHSGRLDETFGRLGRFIVLGMLLVGSIVAMSVWFIQFTPWGHEASVEVQRLVALLLVAQFFAGIGYLGQLRLYYSTRPSLASVAVGTNVVALVVGLIVLVPRYGAVGAAVAELLAGIVTFAVLVVTVLISVGDVRRWTAVAVPLLTFAPCMAASWLADRRQQLAVFAVTLLGYAVVLFIHARRYVEVHGFPVR
jgi:O-antigen/teichoic acid export membrane protein